MTKTALNGARELLKSLEAERAKKAPAADACNGLVQRLKLELVRLGMVPPIDNGDGLFKEKLELARKSFEVACLESIRQCDVETFERHMSLLKVFYFDYGATLPNSELRCPILGLNLLHLLVANRIAEFHTELELMKPQSLLHECIRYPVALEQELMEGSYRSLWDASRKLPFSAFKFFVDGLVNTARERIADCCESAYDSLQVTQATKLLKISAATDTTSFVGQRSWVIQNDKVLFQKEMGPDLDIPAYDLMAKGLSYAVELERIV